MNIICPRCGEKGGVQGAIEPGQIITCPTCQHEFEPAVTQALQEEIDSLAEAAAAADRQAKICLGLAAIFIVAAIFSLMILPICAALLGSAASICLFAWGILAIVAELRAIRAALARRKE